MRKALIGIAVVAMFVLNGCFLSNNSTGPAVASSTTVVPVSSAVLASSASVVTQSYFGLKPATASIVNAQARYAEWKAQYYMPIENESFEVPAIISMFHQTNPLTDGSARILWDKDTMTVSEGIGYGMLIAYFMQDYVAFNRLLQYHHAFRYTGSYLMQWKVESFYFPTTGSATDADIDVATAELLYYETHPTETAYLTDALGIANEIWNTELTADGSYMIIPGNAGWTKTGDPGKTTASYNPSYFSPVALRLFAKHDLTHAWQVVLDKNYAWLSTMSLNGAGLWPNWANAAGVPTKPVNDPGNVSMFAWFYTEAYRIPWRLAWDYSWYGDPRAQVMLARAANYVISQDVTYDAIKERYLYAGGSKYGIGKAGIKGGICMAAIADPALQAWVNNCTAELSTTAIAPRSNDYFNPILGMLYTAFLNGLYVKPN